jgi:hypothetical protein
MKDLWVTLFTGKDNRSLDIGRVIWLLSVLSFIVFAFLGLYMDKPTDYIAYGTGLSTLLAAGGAALNLKSKTEPEDRQE